MPVASWGVSRNEGHSTAGGTSGMVASVKTKPGRSLPKTATVVRPTAPSAVVRVAVSCDILRPVRSRDTSTETGPGEIWDTNIVVIVRSCCSGRPRWVSMARAAMAVISPPCGVNGAFHSGESSTS